MRANQLIWIFLFSFCFSGCGLVLGWVFRPCDVDVSERLIKASCGLTNGVYFEELVPDRMGADGLPDTYRITARFQCYNPGVEGVQTYWPDKLYFGKQNEHYRWAADTVEYSAIRTGKTRQLIRVDAETGDTVRLSGAYHVWNGTRYTTCPIAFKRETWYFLSVMDPSLTGVYLYVDDRMRFHIHEIESGVSPI